jgi:hexosaminidase
VKYLIPAPKKVEINEGTFAPTEHLTVFYGKGLAYFADDIRRRLASMTRAKLTPIEVSGKENVLVVRPNGFLDQQNDSTLNLSGEGYVLEITTAAICLEATSKRGFVNAWSTLAQIISYENKLPAFKITDHPDMGLRGIHLDLKGCMPTAEYLCEMLERMALHKINAVLVEYEDKFPYQSYPELRAETSLSLEEIGKFVETAKQFAIEVIPKVQCIGHVEYILRHEPYRHLAETLSTFCPLKEGTWDMVKTMIAEVMSCHADSSYFHIGADEAHFGRCPECREFVRQHGKEELYFRYVSRAAEYVIGQGKKPIVWSDPFTHWNFIEKLDRLPKETIIHHWDYRFYDSKSAWLLWHRRKTVSKRWVEVDPTEFTLGSRYEGLPKFIEDLPQEEQNLISHYMFEGGEPDRGDPLFWVNVIMDRGFTVIGGPAIKNVAGNNTFYTDFDLRYRNTDVWAKKAVESRLPGMINTAWSRPRSPKPPAVPMELLWYNIVASAELCWNAQTAKADFDARFDAAYAEGAPLSKAIDYLSLARRSKNPAYSNAATYLIENMMMNILRPNLFLQIINITAKYQQLVMKWDTSISDAGEWLAYYLSVQDRMIHRTDGAKEYIETLERYRQSWLEWETEAVDLLKTFMPEAEALETVCTKSRIYIYRCEDTMNRLRSWNTLTEKEG